MKKMRLLLITAFATLVSVAPGLVKEGGQVIDSTRPATDDVSPDSGFNGDLFDVRTIPDGAEMRDNPNGRPHAIAPGTDFRYCIKVGVVVDQAMINLIGSVSETRKYFDELLRRISTFYEHEWQAKLRLATGFADGGMQVYNGWKRNNGSDRLDELGALYNNGKFRNDKKKANLIMYASGKELDGGGIAWMEGLFSYEYQYSVVLGMEGGFSKWDMMVVAHELGHQFGADHTHEIGIDKCANNCRQDIPKRCDPRKPLETSFCGSIMSYCHICMTGPGDMDNVVFDFHGKNQNIVNKLFGKHDINYDLDGTCEGDSIGEPHVSGGGGNNNGGNNNGGDSVDNNNNGGNNGPRVTDDGAQCMEEWMMDGSEFGCFTYCCNPDQDAGGEWCFTNMQGGWGYCKEPRGGGGDEVDEGNDGPRDCARPLQGNSEKPWCYKYEYHSLDCDGDGALDHICLGANNGRMGTIFSSGNCKPTWGEADAKARCPAFFGLGDGNDGNDGNDTTDGGNDGAKCPSATGKAKKKPKFCNKIDGCTWSKAPVYGKKGGCVVEGTPKPSCPDCNAYDGNAKQCKKKLGKKVCKFNKNDKTCSPLKKSEYLNC